MLVANEDSLKTIAAAHAQQMRNDGYCIATLPHAKRAATFKPELLAARLNTAKWEDWYGCLRRTPAGETTDNILLRFGREFSSELKFRYCAGVSRNEFMVHLKPGNSVVSVQMGGGLGPKIPRQGFTMFYNCQVKSQVVVRVWPQSHVSTAGLAPVTLRVDPRRTLIVDNRLALAFSRVERALGAYMRVHQVQAFGDCDTWFPTYNPEPRTGLAPAQPKPTDVVPKRRRREKSNSDELVWTQWETNHVPELRVGQKRTMEPAEDSIFPPFKRLERDLMSMFNLENGAAYPSLVGKSSRQVVAMQRRMQKLADCLEELQKDWDDLIQSSGSYKLPSKWKHQA